MTDPESIIVRWTPTHGSSQRFVFEPRVEGFARHHDVWTQERWRRLGTETVENVAFEGVPDENRTSR